MNTRIRGCQASDGRLPVSSRNWYMERPFRRVDGPAVRRFTQVSGHVSVACGPDGVRVLLSMTTR
jgi:hypothetical protein